MKIAVAGLGYVGIANAVMLLRHHDVTAVDIDAARVAALNARRSTIDDPEVSDWLANRLLRLTAIADPSAYAGAEVVLIATPTDYDQRTNRFDTSSVEAVLAQVRAASDRNARPCHLKTDRALLLVRPEPLCPTRHARLIVSTIHNGRYPSLLSRGRAGRPDAYLHRHAGKDQPRLQPEA